jgi:UDP:flavonoid glycosyltransferase YjiC (YdhE family)
VRDALMPVGDDGAVRVLVSSTAGAGHFTPVVPLAHACRAAGHDVAVAAPASFADAVARAGLDHLPFADAPPDELGAIFARLPGLPRAAANEVVMREVFAGVDARSALPGLDETVRAWRPDVIVRDPAEFASYVVAERHGVPHVSAAIGPAALEEFMLPLVDEPLRALGAERGAEGVRAAPVVSLVPPVLDGPRAGSGAVTRVRYDTPPAPETEPLPAWGDPDAPLVYVSYGTITATIGPFAAIYPATVAALADRPVRVLLTVGDGADDGALGPLPGNVRVERFRPQQTVMPIASAVVGHGGFGTTMTALAHAVPLVVLPLFASDQHINADAVAAAGAGVAVPGELDGAAHLAAAVDAVLADGTFAAGARRVADEIDALPPVGSAVPVLERLGGAAPA